MENKWPDVFIRSSIHEFAKNVNTMERDKKFKFVLYEIGDDDDSIQTEDLGSINECVFLR